MTEQRSDLADRIERWMHDAAAIGEGSVFDLMPDEQPTVIAALRAAAEIARLEAERDAWAKEARDWRDAPLPAGERRTNGCIDCDGTGRYPSGAACKSCEGSGRVQPGDGISVSTSE